MPKCPTCGRRLHRMTPEDKQTWREANQADPDAPPPPDWLCWDEDDDSGCMGNWDTWQLRGEKERQEALRILDRMGESPDSPN
jgi:hypothetical protein